MRHATVKPVSGLYDGPSPVRDKCGHAFTPSPLLVGIETNPGPGGLFKRRAGDLRPQLRRVKRYGEKTWKLNTTPLTKHQVSKYKDYLGSALEECVRLPIVTIACVDTAIEDLILFKKALVGVELNPGPTLLPRSARPYARAGYAIAKLVSKRKKPAKKKPQARVMDNSRSISRVAAPLAMGMTSTSGVKHNPIIISGSVAAVQVRRQVAAPNTYLANAGGATGQLNTFNFDLVADGSTSNDFMNMPTNVRKLAACFSMYRLRKLIIRWEPFVNTSTDGNIVLAVVPEPTAAAAQVCTAEFLYSQQVNTVTSVWKSASINALNSGGLRKDWLYIDGTDTTAEAQLRQESPGCIGVELQGTSTNTTFGQLWFDYELEFRGIGTLAGLTLLAENERHLERARLEAIAEGPSIADSCSCGPIHVEHDEDMEASIHVPREVYKHLLGAVSAVK